MGKALILNDRGKGQYLIKEIYKTSQLSARKTEVIASMTKVNGNLTSVKAKITLKNIEVEDKFTQLQNLVTGEHNLQDELLLRKQLAELKTELDNLKSTERTLDAKYFSLFYELKALDQDLAKYANPMPVEAWCITFTEGLTGEVDTIELSDEVNAPHNEAILISPTTHNTTRTLTPAREVGAYTLVYNWIALPAQQYWRPEYRAGKITSIDAKNNTCNITFQNESEVSSVRGVHNAAYVINKTPNLVDVPVFYGNCGTSAFKVGDRVVVSFHRNWDTPRIAGFVNNPRVCTQSNFVFGVPPKATVIKFDANSHKIYDGIINTPGLPDYTSAYGGIFDWTDGNNYITWGNPTDTYFLRGRYEAPLQTDRSGNTILQSGILYDEGKSIFGASSPNIIYGAAVKVINGVKRYIVLMSRAPLINTLGVDSTPFKLVYAFVENRATVKTGEILLGDLHPGPAFHYGEFNGIIGVNKDVTEACGVFNLHVSGFGTNNIGDPFYYVSPEEFYPMTFNIDMVAKTVTLGAIESPILTQEQSNYFMDYVGNRKVVGFKFHDWVWAGELSSSSPPFKINSPILTVTMDGMVIVEPDTTPYTINEKKIILDMRYGFYYDVINGAFSRTDGGGQLSTNILGWKISNEYSSYKVAYYVSDKYGNAYVKAGRHTPGYLGQDFIINGSTDVSLSSLAIMDVRIYGLSRAIFI